MHLLCTSNELFDASYVYHIEQTHTITLQCISAKSFNDFADFFCADEMIKYE